MAVEFYEYEGGFVVDPESETKEVFIPSPPTTMTVKINPRPVVIYIAGGKVAEGYDKLEALKAYCEENNVCFICPSSDDSEEVAATYTYVVKHAKKLNVKADEITMKCAPGCEQLAADAQEYMFDELDAELEDEEIETFEA